MNRIAPFLGLVLISSLLFFMGCGPEDASLLNDNAEYKLDSASDNYLIVNGRITEYGQCRDTIDNDGDGLADEADPDCHIPEIDVGGVVDAFPDTIRDLSLYPFPLGHNFNPDITRMLLIGPGAPPPCTSAVFRDRAQFTEWLRFLTNGNGYVDETELFGPGVNPFYTPVPAPAAVHINNGTTHLGNNNNVNPRDLHDWYLHPLPVAATGVLPPAPEVPCAQEVKVEAPCPAPAPQNPCPTQQVRAPLPQSPCPQAQFPVRQNAYPVQGSQAITASVASVEAPVGGPATIYQGNRFGVPYKTGSQGFRNRVDTGNVDRR